jgi:dTDP-4-amino-4,6-dideoxygalactose transaminase
VLELEAQLRERLDVPMLQVVTNGTIAIQLALKALDISGEVLTTPFSYVATTTALMWEHCTPRFVDINERDFCIDADKIEQAITSTTQAILATHVYGYPCDVERIGAIAQKHGLKVVYDAAHAFGTKYKGRSVLSYGDLSTLSFHATKLFHTIEGGAIAGPDAARYEKIWLLKSFGHKYDDYYTVGINGKVSEVHAAMGLCLLPKVDGFIRRRREICEMYDALLRDVGVVRPQPLPGVEYNYSYYPVVFASESELERVRAALAENDVNTRRYFYPSLNRLPYLEGEACPISESIAKRVLCLPLYVELADEDVDKICRIVREQFVPSVCQ